MHYANNNCSHVFDLVKIDSNGIISIDGTVMLTTRQLSDCTAVTSIKTGKPIELPCKRYALSIPAQNQQFKLDIYFSEFVQNFILLRGK